MHIRVFLSSMASERKLIFVIICSTLLMKAYKKILLDLKAQKLFTSNTDWGQARHFNFLHIENLGGISVLYQQSRFVCVFSLQRFSIFCFTKCLFTMPYPVSQTYNWLSHSICPVRFLPILNNYYIFLL